MRHTKVERPLGKLRGGDYPDKGDQHDAQWKILRVLIDLLTPEQREQLPADAIEVMDRVQAVKTKFPKKPPRPSKPRAGKRSKGE